MATYRRETEGQPPKAALPKEHNDAQQNSKQGKLPDTGSLCMR
jgi:hypothetical protein